jgi:hypothetical protein
MGSECTKRQKLIGCVLSALIIASFLFLVAFCRLPGAGEETYTEVPEYARAFQTMDSLTSESNMLLVLTGRAYEQGYQDGISKAEEACFVRIREIVNQYENPRP